MEEFETLSNDYEKKQCIGGSQANEGLTPYLAGQKYAIRFYD